MNNTAHAAQYAAGYQAALRDLNDILRRGSVQDARDYLRENIRAEVPAPAPSEVTPAAERKVPEEILGASITKHRRTKVIGLTASNVAALRQAVEEAGLVLENLTKTTATFYGTPGEAIITLDVARNKLANLYGGRGHPVQSIPAVRRKLAAEAKAGR